MLTQPLRVTFQAMATLCPISMHLQTGVGSEGSLVWEASIGRLDIFEVNPQDFLILDLRLWLRREGRCTSATSQSKGKTEEDLGRGHKANLHTMTSQGFLKMISNRMYFLDMREHFQVSRK